MTAWGDDIITVVSQRLSDTSSCARHSTVFGQRSSAAADNTTLVPITSHSLEANPMQSITQSSVAPRTRIHTHTYMDFSRLRMAMILQRNVRLSVV